MAHGSIVTTTVASTSRQPSPTAAAASRTASSSAWAVGSPDRTRISLDGGPSPFVAHPATPLPVVVPAPPPPPRLEHAIQPPTDLAVSGDPSAGSVGAAAYRNRAPIVRAPTTEAAKNVFGL